MARRIIQLILFGFVAAAPAFAAEVEAKKNGVAVYSKPTNKSQVIAKLKSGQSLPSIERKGMYWQVKLKNGDVGFVSVMQVKHRPGGDSDLAKAIKSVVKDGRPADDGSSRARSAVMGVRGLREDDDAANAGNVRPNLRAVFQMEDLQVSEKRVEALGEEVFAEIASKAKD